MIDKLINWVDYWIAKRAFNALYWFTVNNDIELEDYEPLVKTLDVLRKHIDK